MNFTTVDMLYLFWTIPIFFVLYVYGMRRRQRILKEYATPHGLKYLCPDALNHRRWVKTSLVLGGAILMVLAMSGPQYGYKWQTVERKGVDIIIALDCSKSMLATDVKPTRLERAKREIRDLLELLQGDRVGLISFAGTAFLNCPLTLDYHSFFIFVDHLSPEYLPVGGTDLSTALETAFSAFDPEANTEKAVILITDGEHTGQTPPVEAAASLNKKKIKLFCIGVGKKEGVPVPEKGGGFKKNRSGGIILSKLDETVLQQMALSTGGAYVRSITGDMDLETIYLKEIKGKMEQATLSDNRLKVWEDRFQWPLALAILLLAWAFLLPVGKQGEHPNG